MNWKKWRHRVSDVLVVDAAECVQRGSDMNIVNAVENAAENDNHVDT